MKTATQLNQELAEHFEQIASIHRLLAQLSMTATDEVAAKSPQRDASVEGNMNSDTRYKIAPDYIGKVAQIFKAMYDVGMFVKADGTRATNVEDLARCIGHALGEDFPNWRQTLREAVLPANSLEIFTELGDKAKKYKDKVDK